MFIAWRGSEMTHFRETIRICLNGKAIGCRLHVCCLIFSLAIFPAASSFSQETLIFSAPMANAYAKKSGQGLEGPSVDLIKSLFSDHDIAIKTVPLPWPRALEYLKSGKIDAVAPIFYNPERAKFIEYSIPFDSHETRVLVKRNRVFEFNNWDDLIGRSGAIVRGRSEGEAFDKFSAEHLNLIKVDSLNQITMMVVSGRIEYGIDKMYDIIIRSKKLGLADQIEILSMPIAINQNHIGFSKKSPFVSYLPEINEKITQLKEQGKIRKMVFDFINNTNSD
jgi:ABC-type amino acid transport substrate-binding protein